MLNIPERSRRETDHGEGERWLLFVLGCFHSIFKPPDAAREESALGLAHSHPKRHCQ